MMTTYAPQSSLGWLDFDAAASERVGTLMRALEEPGTLDPIGLGSVRDAFSAMIAPGTATIQTRLRYFLFVPWICQAIERERVSTARFRARLRDDEARLIDCLRHLGPNNGVQGFTAGHDLQRMPSEAYWGGLGTWGIRRLDYSISEYGKRLPALCRMSSARDDDGNPSATGVSMWSPLTPPPDRFLDEDASFELTSDEALLLTDHLRRLHGASLLAAATSFPAEAAAAPMPWDVPPHLLTPELREILRHARNVSELTLGPQLVYNLLLARRANEEFGWDTSMLEDRLLVSLGDWTGVVGARHAELQTWVGDIDSFWALVARHANITEPTKSFVGSMVASATSNPSGFAEDSRVHGLIRDREIRLKSKRARLANRTALENWNQQPFGAQLSYRWSIVQSYLDDLSAALEGGA